MDYITNYPFQSKKFLEWGDNDYADFYRYEWGINCVPSNGCQLYKGKDVPPEHLPEPWKEWTNKPISLELHEKWKKEKKFDQGIMRVTGNIWHREDLKDDYLYGSADFDNSLAINEFMPNNPLESSKKHVIEMHLGNSEKCHWEFYIKKDSKLVGKANDSRNTEINEKLSNNEIPSFEIKIGNGVMFGAPSMHPDGTKYGFLGINTPQLIDGDKVQDKIEKIYIKYNFNSGGNKTNENNSSQISEMVQSGSIIEKNHNRSLGGLRFIDSLYRRLGSLELPDEYFENSAFWFYKEHTAPGYTDERIRSNVKQSIEFVKKQMNEEKNTTYQSMLNFNPTDDKDIFNTMCEIVKFNIIEKKEINIITIGEILKKWVKTHSLEKVKPKTIHDAIKIVFYKYDNFDVVKKNIKEYHCKLDQQPRFDEKQTIETAEWIAAKYNLYKLALDGKMIYHDGQCYSFKTKSFINQQISECLPLADNVTANKVLTYLERNSSVLESKTIEKFNHIKCLKNGTYNIKIGEFKENVFDPKYFVIHKIPHSYINNSTPDDFPTINKILFEIINDKNNLKIFYDFCSICTYPDIGIYLMLIFLGMPGTGKKQINILIKNMFGADNITNFTLHDLARDPTNQIEAARGMLNQDEDMSPDDNITITSILKWITRDSFSTRGIYSQPEKFEPMSRLMANANDLFEIGNNHHAQALYDRVHVIQLKKKFRKTDEEISDIVSNTVPEEEYDYFLSFILDNAHKLFRTKNIKNIMSPKEVEQIWNKYSNGIKKFYSIWIKKSPSGFLVRDDLWEKWNDYAIDNNIAVGGLNKFYKKFDEMSGQEKSQHKSKDGFMKWGYAGVVLKTQEEVNLENQTNFNNYTE